ncbi:ABC transporter permease subunit [Actinotalea sp. JY-7876]|uniref:ABC transporter permease subunit n=1 Tax=Actinotalea sp. JY-7876 TaxID=2758442 RepID=UPI0015F6E8CC|nr:ABC transporter permease subunit [Actinotalea sp. JY-7876]
MRLFAVEVRRLLARRMLVAVVGAGLATVVLVAIGVFFSSRPLSAADLEQAQRSYEAALEEWELNGEEMIADCEEAEAAEREATGTDVDYGCDQMTAPQEEWFVPQAQDFASAAPGVLATTALLLAFLAVLLGVTATAAELTTGAMGTWLTFVPRRTAVLASKLAAAGTVALVVVTVLVLLLVGGVWIAHAANDATGTATAASWREIGGIALRLVLLGGVAGVLGAALGVLLRHTAAALGVLAGWALVVESLVSGLWPDLQPWLLRTNVLAWVQDGTTYWTQECTVGAQGTVCEGVEHAVSLGQGGLWLLVVSALLVALTGAVFRVRDVT